MSSCPSRARKVHDLHDMYQNVVMIANHSSWDTPGLIPNPAVKLAHVACCTEVRESPGTVPIYYCLLSYTVILNVTLKSECSSL